MTIVKERREDFENLVAEYCVNCGEFTVYSIRTRIFSYTRCPHCGKVTIILPKEEE